MSKTVIIGRCDIASQLLHPSSQAHCCPASATPPVALPPDTRRLVLADGLLQRDLIMRWLALAVSEGVETWVLASRLPVLAQAGISPCKRDHFIFYRFKANISQQQPLLKLLSLLAAILLLPLVLPLIALTALYVALKDGLPLFFIQKRVGIKGRPFVIFKFRTMQRDGEQQLQITSGGEYLRRSGIDELPQFFNLLTGNMLLVGPRPLPIAERNRALQSAAWVGEREVVMPGLTGLYQITPERRKLGLADMCLLDFYWICNRSCLFNLWILLQTLKAMWFGWGKSNCDRKPRQRQ